MSVNFWELNDGSSATETDGKFESGGGDMEPIPNNTGCLAAIEEANWSEFQGDEYINLRWRVLQPAAYANRVVFQKIRVLDKDPAKADKAKRMLAAIDANSGGCLRQLEGAPTDEDLMRCLSGKKHMGIKVMVWKMEIQGEQRSGNWVSAVAPAGAAKAAPPPKPKAQPSPQPAPQSDDDFDNDIPF